MRATGSFEVAMKPLPLADEAGPMLGRLSIEKRFEGDLQGTSTGEMLSAGTAVEGSAAYVAIERVVGVLHGREGTFVLRHSGTMNRGVPSLEVTVVPDSAGGELEGLAGTMEIEVSPGHHGYAFEYTLPDGP